ncbi:MAG: hypothetical protein ACRD5Z_19500 [Bryobacteraceae bacterium]
MFGALLFNLVSEIVILGVSFAGGTDFGGGIELGNQFTCFHASTILDEPRQGEIAALTFD